MSRHLDSIEKYNQNLVFEYRSPYLSINITEDENGLVMYYDVEDNVSLEFVEENSLNFKNRSDILTFFRKVGEDTAFNDYFNKDVQNIKDTIYIEKFINKQDILDL